MRAPGNARNDPSIHATNFAFIMNRKKIVVMGFMGGCPIAGVIWPHLHYIVGLSGSGTMSITSRIRRG